MKLLTKAILKKLPAIYSQDDKPETEVTAHVRFFDPQGSMTWYATEFDGENTFFGLKVNEYTKESWLGYFYLTDLQFRRGRLHLPCERDMWWDKQTIAEIKSEL